MTNTYKGTIACKASCWQKDKWMDVRFLSRVKKNHGFDIWANNQLFDLIIKTWDPEFDQFCYALHHCATLRYCRVDEDGQETDDWQSPEKIKWSWSGHGRVVAFRIQRSAVDSLNDATAVWDAQNTLNENDPLDVDEEPADEEDSTSTFRYRKTKTSTRKSRGDEV